MLLIASNVVLSAESNITTAIGGAALLVYGVILADHSMVSRLFNLAVILGVLAADVYRVNPHSLLIAYPSLYL